MLATCTLSQQPTSATASLIEAVFAGRLHDWLVDRAAAGPRDVPRARMDPPLLRMHATRTGGRARTPAPVHGWPGLPRALIHASGVPARRWPCMPACLPPQSRARAERASTEEADAPRWPQQQAHVACRPAGG
jgi:hypothetical protein